MNTDTQRGFTLVELMIAVLIALFLIGGLLTLVQAMKSTSLNQNGLSQLQESERMAMTLMTDVIQSAGYFPNPLINTAASSFPVSAPFTTAGQTLFGSGNFTGGTGQQHNGALSDERHGQRHAGQRHQLPREHQRCRRNVGQHLQRRSSHADSAVHPRGEWRASAPVQLISGVNRLQIYYGVQTNTAVGTNSIDAYLDAATVTAGNYWGNVKSVKITLTFVNPLFGQAGQTTVGQFITFTRIVDVMNKNGVTT